MLIDFFVTEFFIRGVTGAARALVTSTDPVLRTISPSRL